LVLGVWDFIDSTTPSLQETAARGDKPLKPHLGEAQSRVLWSRILDLALYLREYNGQ